jgi:hypothetical protein
MLFLLRQADAFFPWLRRKKKGPEDPGLRHLG